MMGTVLAFPFHFLAKLESLRQKRTGIPPESTFGRSRDVLLCSVFFILFSNVFHCSLDWLKGKSTGNYGFYHQI